MLSSPHMLFSLFPAFFDRPEKMRFGQQEENEVVELFLRRHGITNAGWITIALIGFILPPILIQLDTITFQTNYLSILPGQILAGILVIWYMLVLAFVLENFLFWYFNIYIVTNIHLEDISLHNLLSRDALEIELNDIQSVKPEINGILQSLFNFGNVNIKTSADRENIVFDKVPKPDFVADRIQDVRAVYISAGGGLGHGG